MAENLGLSHISLADGKACRMCIWLSFKITHEYKSLVGKIEKRKRKGERERARCRLERENRNSIVCI